MEEDIKNLLVNMNSPKYLAIIRCQIRVTALGNSVLENQTRMSNIPRLMTNDMSVNDSAIHLLFKNVNQRNTTRWSFASTDKSELLYAILSFLLMCAKTILKGKIYMVELFRLSFLKMQNMFSVYCGMELLKLLNIFLLLYCDYTCTTLPGNSRRT